MRKGFMPIDPYKGDRVISTKVNPEFQKRLREIAVRNDTTVAVIVKTAVFEYMARNQN